jgi:hypothetical protein
LPPLAWLIPKSLRFEHEMSVNPDLHRDDGDIEIRNWDETSESVEKNQGLVKNAIIESGYRSPRRVSIDILMR